MFWVINLFQLHLLSRLTHTNSRGQLLRVFHLFVLLNVGTDGEGNYLSIEKEVVLFPNFFHRNAWLPLQTFRTEDAILTTEADRTYLFCHDYRELLPWKIVLVEFFVGDQGQL